MATFTAATFNFGLSIDANYRALWGAVDTQIQGLGDWTYVSQTGDSDPSAATAGSNDTYPSWRVYSTSVGSETWYLRLDFGHNANGAALKVQVGSSVNGSGTLGGQASTQTTLTNGFAETGTGETIYVAQAAGRLMVCIGGAGSVADNHKIAFSLCGGLDSSGAMLSGMQIFTVNGSGGTTGTAQQVPVSGTVPARLACWPCATDVVADTTTGGQVISYHPFLWDSAGGKNPTLAVAIGGTSNSTAGSTTTLTVYAGSHVFLATNCVNQNIASGNNRALLLYE
jgi:hypothetical protein